ncbi:Glycosyl transferases group 1 [Dermatophilus congolensis]|uniref:Glycosyl transferases group 1 n=1 Tax=Dermatophilus congolensis TaxID=1863 RepID=A0AA46H0X3_9MICO|nr:glycosyltransferase [Dermatophilus congolensis]STD11642.1 Glycosyl transferases group 1 [Dermatophilus congolensis]
MRSSYDVSFVTSGHDVADARLHREVQALVARGMSVEVLGLGDPADGPTCASVRTWKRPHIIARAPLAARMAASAGGRVLVTLDPDSAVAAGTIVMSSGRVLVVDIHEDYAALLRDRPWANKAAGLPGIIGNGIVEAFTTIAKRAALTLVADDHVPPLEARNRLVLRNEPVPALLPDPADPDPKPRAVYIGDVRRSRGLFAMIEALRLAPDWTLDIVGPVAPADAEELTASCDSDNRLAERVRLHGRRPPHAAWEIARGAWAGLVLLAETPAFQQALPSKLGEYLACGLPVISTDLPRQHDVLADTEAGILVPVGEDAAVGAAVAAHMQKWSERPEIHARARAAALTEATRLRSARSGYDDFADAISELLTVR